MCKILRRSLILALVPVIMLGFALPALAATKISADGEAAKYQTNVSGGTLSYTVVITNNYGGSDTVEITLATPAITNVVFWVYMPGEPDKTAQLGSITIKKNATTGRLGVAAAKFGDFTEGYVNVTTAGGAMTKCEYGKSEVTEVNVAGKVSLRNSPSGAELLIVDGSIVTKGMAAYAVVNGKIYKATASKDGADLQVSLATNMEPGTPVWFTVAAAGCMDVGYSKLLLGDVEKTTIAATTEFKLFYQGPTTSTSSLLIIGLNPGDTVRCTSADGSVRKSATVPTGATMVTVSSMKLAAGSQLLVTITEKSKTESDAKTITVPNDAVPTAVRATAVSISNVLTGSTASATITVKNVTIGDTINIYNALGVRLGGGSADIDLDDPDALVAEVVIDGLNLGTSSSTIYLSVTSNNSESAWLKYTAPMAKAAPPTP